MVWPTNYITYGGRTNGVVKNDDTVNNPLRGQALLD
jgi:hypothetical protein